MIDNISDIRHSIIDKDGYNEYVCESLDKLVERDSYNSLTTYQVVFVAEYLLNKREYEKAITWFMIAFQRKDLSGDVRSYFNAVGIKTKTDLFKWIKDASNHTESIKITLINSTKEMRTTHLPIRSMLL